MTETDIAVEMIGRRGFVTLTVYCRTPEDAADRCWELFTRLGEVRVYERHRLVADHGAEVVFVGKLPGDCSPLSGGIA